jgi:hypothetical protein
MNRALEASASCALAGHRVMPLGPRQAQRNRPMRTTLSRDPFSCHSPGVGDEPTERLKALRALRHQQHEQRAMHHVLLAMAAVFAFLALVAWRGLGGTDWTGAVFIAIAVVPLIGALVWVVASLLSIIPTIFFERRDKEFGIWDDEQFLDRATHPFRWKGKPIPGPDESPK